MEEKRTEIEVRRIDEVTGTLFEAFGRLMPQLSPALAAPDAERLRSLLADRSTALFAAWDEGRIVGILTLVWYDVPSGRKAWIEDVVVDAAARGRGVGEALVQAAVEQARLSGIDRVSLTSNPSRTAARALYRKMGFEAVETTVFARKIVEDEKDC